MVCLLATYACIYISNECFDYIVMASASCNSSLVTNPECFTLSDSTQYSTEVNEMYIPPATSEIVIGVQKMIVDDYNQTELVIGKEHFIPVSFSNSELVLHYRNMIK